jgi:hypothetical protein
VNQLLGRQHLRNDRVTNDIENVVGYFLYVFRFAKVVEFFDVENRIHVGGLDEFARLVFVVGFDTAIRDFVDEFVFRRVGFLGVFAHFRLLSYHLYIQLFLWAFYLDNFARIQNVVGEKTDVFRNKDESELNDRELGVIFLDITVKYL